MWYVLSVAATGGDMLWPVAYAHALGAYFGPDFTANAFQTVSLPGLLLRFGVPHVVSIAAGVALLAAGAVLFARVPPLEAASIAGTRALAASPHALPYDAVFVLPTIFFALESIAEPWRTRLVITAYVVAPLWMLSNFVHFDALAVIVIGAVAAWFVARSSPDRRSPRPVFGRP